MARYHRQSRRPSERPTGTQRPQVVLVVFAAAAVLMALTGFVAGLSWRWIGIVAVSVALTGIIQGVREWGSLNRQRAAADQWLQRQAGRRFSPSYAWRVSELTSRRERRILAHSLAAAAREARQRPGPIGATVVSRASVRPYTAELTSLAERLTDLERPVSPSGMLLVRDLLTSPRSPLYEAARAHEIPATVATILRTLDLAGRRE